MNMFEHNSCHLIVFHGIVKGYGDKTSALVCECFCNTSTNLFQGRFVVWFSINQL